MVVSRIFPSSPRRGGCAIKKTSRSILSPRRRGGVQPQQNSAEFDHHPVRSIRRLRDILLMSRPPLLGEEGKIADLRVSTTASSARVRPKRGLKPAITMIFKRAKEIMHSGASHKILVILG